MQIFLLVVCRLTMSLPCSIVLQRFIIALLHFTTTHSAMMQVLFLFLLRQYNAIHEHVYEFIRAGEISNELIVRLIF